MVLFSRILTALAFILDQALQLYMWVIIIAALITWVQPNPYNPVVMFLERITEPVLRPIRRILPPIGLDISPVIAIFAIMFVRMVIPPTLRDLAYSIVRI
ncbi:MAG: YggT family protein [Nitrospirota bacterium]|nr:YggT family protein [Nitrospirota bacterium]